MVEVGRWCWVCFRGGECFWIVGWERVEWKEAVELGLLQILLRMRTGARGLGYVRGAVRRGG